MKIFAHFQASLHLWLGSLFTEGHDQGFMYMEI